MAEKFAYMCVVCGTTLGGSLGWLFHQFGIRRCSRNPNVCNRCDAHLQEGRIIELSVLFADLTGFTEMTNRLGADKTYEVLDSFFKMTNEVLVNNDAFIDKYIGDAVMAFFNAPIQSTEHARKAAYAAIGIQDGIKALAQNLGLNLRARVGVASGFARVGMLGSTDSKDYTAIGDVVNLASRLEALASPEEILIDGQVYSHISADYPGLQPETLVVRGFVDPIQAYRIRKSEKYHNSEPVQMDAFTRRQSVSIGAVLFAIFGAPCAAVTILSPLAVLLGAGTLFSAMAPTLTFLDAAVIRIPLQLFAVLGAVINLYVIWYGISRRNKSAHDELTFLEKRKVSVIKWISIISLFMVAFETYAHIFIEGQPLF